MSKDTVTKTEALVALEKVKMFFEQFDTGRFDNFLHEVHNDEINANKRKCDVLMIAVRTQLKFGEL